MRPNLLILAATCAITLLPALAASGAVDPGVSDRGPHSASLRALGQGNGQFSIRQDITQRVPWLAVQPGRVDPQTGLVLPQPFEISIPGVHAYVQRPTYLVRAPDGNLSPNLPPGQSNNYFQLPGPNTVYSLIPPTHTHTHTPAQSQLPQAAATSSQWRDTRLSTRFSTRLGKLFTTRFSTEIRGRINGQVTANIRPASLPAGTYIDHPAPSASQTSAPQPNAALRQLIDRLNERRRAKVDLPPATQSSLTASPRPAASQSGVHRVGDVPPSIGRELHVVDQSHRSQTNSNQRDHSTGK